MQALERICKSSMTGTFTVKNARRLLLKAGLIDNPKNASSVIHTVINRSERFERVRRGEYRLKEQPKLVTEKAS